MRKIVIVGMVFGLLSCNHISLKKEVVTVKDQLALTISEPENQTHTKNVATLIKDAIISVKTYIKEEGDLQLHYKYPYLNPEEHANFNVAIQETYLKMNQPVKEVLNAEYLSCDPSADNVQRLKRKTDFKIYKREKNLISLLVYKTNYYDDPTHTSHIFKGINYDLEKGVFLGYEDLFQKGSSQEVLALLNSKLQNLIEEDTMYSNCSLLTTQQFALMEDNFVIDGQVVKFYFDDCTICPSYTGNHFIEIPVAELKNIHRGSYL